MAACPLVGDAQPSAESARLKVSFPAAENGSPSESVATLLGSDPLCVVIVAAGANPTRPRAHSGNQEVPVKMLGHDPVSRLGFIRASGNSAGKLMPWAANANQAVNASLNVVEDGRVTSCQATGWVKQVGGKVLPFALLRVEFTATVPSPGTPLADGAGRIVGVVFQGSGSGTMGYAIPAEAVHRVRQDILQGGRLIRAWSGIALRAESQTPQISRILPDSPAASAGIQANDVLLSIGTRRIVDYADAANAFFYLIPGQPVSVKLQRAGSPMEFTLTPIKPRS